MVVRKRPTNLLLGVWAPRRFRRVSGALEANRLVHEVLRVIPGIDPGKSASGKLTGLLPAVNRATRRLQECRRAGNRAWRPSLRFLAPVALSTRPRASSRPCHSGMASTGLAPATCTTSSSTTASLLARARGRVYCAEGARRGFRRRRRRASTRRSLGPPAVAYPRGRAASVPCRARGVESRREPGRRNALRSVSTHRIQRGTSLNVPYR